MSFWRRRDVQGTLMMLPYLLVFVLFAIVPLVQTAVTSFCGEGGLLSHYIAAFRLPEFRTALVCTALHTVLAAALVLALAFPTAFLLHPILRRHKRLRFIISTPYASGVMAISLIWLMFFNPQNGLINKLMPLFGLSPQNWLESPVTAFVCIFSLVFWRGFCFTLFNCLQAMDSQPQELYEFAYLAGASKTQTFRHITLPQLLPTLMYVIPVAVVSVLTTFEPVLLMTYAGLDTTVSNTLVYVFYKQAYLNQPGVASAVAMMVLLPILLCSWRYLRYTERRKAVK